MHIFNKLCMSSSVCFSFVQAPAPTITRQWRQEKLDFIVAPSLLGAKSHPASAAMWQESCRAMFSLRRDSKALENTKNKKKMGKGEKLWLDGNMPKGGGLSMIWCVNWCERRAALNWRASERRFPRKGEAIKDIRGNSCGENINTKKAFVTFGKQRQIEIERVKVLGKFADSFVMTFKFVCGTNLHVFGNLFRICLASAEEVKVNCWGYAMWYSVRVCLRMCWYCPVEHFSR